MWSLYKKVTIVPQFIILLLSGVSMKLYRREIIRKEVLRSETATAWGLYRWIVIDESSIFLFGGGERVQVLSALLNKKVCGILRRHYSLRGVICLLLRNSL
jgi:hypothetical protein